MVGNEEELDVLQGRGGKEEDGRKLMGSCHKCSRCHICSTLLYAAAVVVAEATTEEASEGQINE